MAMLNNQMVIPSCFQGASETSGLSHQWKPFPKLCWHKAHAVDRNIVNHLLRTGRAAGELVSISCELVMFPGGRLLAGKC